MDLTKNKFNLIDEHWIPVETESDPNVLLSLREVFEKAHSIRRIASETAPLDAAILRMLLALVHRQMSNYSAQGELVPLISSREAFLRFEEFWDQGYFNMEIFNPYFEDHYDDFWLFGEKKSFGQAPVSKGGDPYSVAKMIPDLSQSRNKHRLFLKRDRNEIERISYAEAARYLLCINFFDDIAVKKKSKNVPSIFPGFGGQICQIYAEGNNLFETLLLNCLLLNPIKEELWPQDRFTWEADPSSWKERRKIEPPNDFGSYMTVRSRLIDLHEKDGYVINYDVMGGDFFDLTHCFEPFTLWTYNEDTNDYFPKCQSKNGTPKTPKLWCNFSSFVQSKKTRPPSVLHWIRLLDEEQVLPENQTITFISPCVFYGPNNSCIGDVSSQAITFFPKLLNKNGVEYRDLVEEEIEKMSKAANYIGYLFKNIASIQGLSEFADKKYQEGSDYTFDQLDRPFKDWLLTVGADTQSIRELREKWENEAYSICKGIIQMKMDDTLDQSNADALLGKRIEREESDKEQDPIKGKHGKSRNGNNSKQNSKFEILSVFDAERLARAFLRKIYGQNK